MTIVKYGAGSIYKNTDQTSWYLDFWQPPVLVRDSSDKLIIIDNKFDKRPDLHSYYLYGDSGYWWVFAFFNQNIIKDPIYDHIAGIQVWVPKKERL